MKEIFKEDTFLHTVFYKAPNKIIRGEVMFAKVFWFGFIGKIIFSVAIFSISQKIQQLLILSYLLIWMRFMWYSRKNVFHQIWFYIGFIIPIIFLFI